MADQQLTCGEIYDFATSFPRKAPKLEMARQLISKLAIKGEKYRTDEEETQYKKFVNTVSTRILSLVNKVQKHHAFERNDISRTDIMIDIEVDCPALVQTDSQTLSQLSYASSTSTMSSSQSKVLEYLEVEPVHRKPFDDYSNKWKRQKTNPVYQEVLDAADAIDADGMDPEKFMAYLGKRISHKNGNYEAEKAFEKIYKGDFGDQKVDLDLCIQLKSTLEIGKAKYIDLRLLLKPCGITLHPYEALNTEIKTFLPDCREEEAGLKSSLRDSLEMTLKRTLDTLNIVPGSEEAEEIVRNGLLAEVSMGADGSGGHSQYNTPTALDVDSTNMLVSGYVLRNVKLAAAAGSADQSEKVLFVEKTPNSSEAEHPLSLLPAKENDKMGAFLNELDAEKIDVETNPIIVDHPELGQIVVRTHCVMSQLDGKAQMIGTGLTGAQCTMCTASEKDCKNPELIKKGFAMDRKITDLVQLFEELEKDPNKPDTLLSKPGDQPIRKGLKQKPQVSSDDLLKNFPVLHSYLRVLDYFENLTYRINAGVRIYGRGKSVGKVNSKKIEEAKNKFRIKAATGPMHLKLDMPDSSGTGAGNTDTGNTARQFFHFKNRQNFVDLVEGTDAEKEAMATLHKNFSVILRLYSSKKTLIDTDDLEKLCTDTNLLLVKTFPWATQPPSVHKLLAHTAQRIRMNGGYGMGDFSEEGLETIHKYVRRYRELLARKNNLFNNIYDVWRALIVRSDPVIRSRKRKLTCKVCNSVGHTKRSCPRRDELTKQGCANEYDFLFSSFVIE